MASVSVCEYTPGSVKCSKGVAGDVTGYGSVVLNGTEVDSLKTYGSLDAKEAIISKAEVMGSAVLEFSKVSDLTVYGSLLVRDSKLGNVVLYSEKSEFNTSTISNILVKETIPRKASVNLYLKEGSTITGNIVFSDNNGIVHIDSSSKILGEVKGGVIK